MNARNLPSPVSPAEPADLDWLAFCYVADELDATEQQAFEERLAQDPHACQAVARAVALARAIDQASALEENAVPPIPVAAPPRRPWHPFWTSISSVAAAAMLVVSGWWMLSDSPSPGVPSDALADAWVNTLVNLDQGEFEMLMAEEVAVALPAEETENWMLAALYDMENEMSAGLDPDSLDPEEAPQQCVE